MKLSIFVMVTLLINVTIANETKNKDIIDKIIKAISNCTPMNKQSLNAKQNMKRHKTSHPFF